MSTYVLVSFLLLSPAVVFSFFFFNVPATPEIYTLSLHDALPISGAFDELGFSLPSRIGQPEGKTSPEELLAAAHGDRKSTRLNSSHTVISYAVFCLKKKNKKL